ncbi:Protein N-acetyltransferase, RimJ/RimL family [Actinomadura meyerae]|uniref:Protein N-acetyltransferase, RimJ/RimL family n=1 Tax=Actinomadura meyerae TaxID=240840 RepID=A0A239N3X8_9ACTN|nr:GNAT family N-acetyltransferase [Actinomadura meyerae]SNT49656.1 Protein N-acetyltransferase, RimJ/RimL family [Actinomadura meyerae]
MTVLETERLTLRPLTGDDFDDYAAMMADPEVADGLADPIGRTPADAWRSLALFIGHREIRGYSHWAVIERATGRFIGRAGPWQPHGFPGLGVGWCLARPHWGKGYATEAARAAIAYCFTDLRADEVISVIRPGNKRSISVAERIGHRLLRETDYKNSPALIYGQQNPAS